MKISELYRYFCSEYISQIQPVASNSKTPGGAVFTEE